MLEAAVLEVVALDAAALETAALELAALDVTVFDEAVALLLALEATGLPHEAKAKTAKALVRRIKLFFMGIPSLKCGHYLTTG